MLLRLPFALARVIYQEYVDGIDAMNLQIGLALGRFLCADMQTLSPRVTSRCLWLLRSVPTHHPYSRLLRELRTIPHHVSMDRCARMLDGRDQRLRWPRLLVDPGLHWPLLLDPDYADIWEKANVHLAANAQVVLVPRRTRRRTAKHGTAVCAESEFLQFHECATVTTLHLVRADRVHAQFHIDQPLSFGHCLRELHWWNISPVNTERRTIDFRHVPCIEVLVIHLPSVELLHFDVAVQLRHLECDPFCLLTMDHFGDKPRLTTVLQPVVTHHWAAYIESCSSIQCKRLLRLEQRQVRHMCVTTHDFGSTASHIAQLHDVVEIVEIETTFLSEPQRVPTHWPRALQEVRTHVALPNPWIQSLPVYVRIVNL
jgi:hypothetical protein